MSLPQVGAEVFLDIDSYENSVNEAIGLANELDSTLSSIADESIDIEATVSADTSDLEAADQIPFDDVVVGVDAQPTAESASVWSILTGFAAGVVVWNAVINVGGAILDVLGRLEAITLEPILDVEDSVARFNAQTGQSVDNLDDMINRLHFVDDVGEDFTDITNVLITANRLGIESFDDMEEAALGALQTAKSQGVSATDTLRAMQILVDQGLADSFTEAADLLTAGIQNGNDRAGDLFNTLELYGPMFAEMGLTGEQAMSLINSGLDAGFRSASDVARAVDTMNKNITGADPGSAIDDALDSIGLELPAQGEQVGEEFFNSIVTGLQNNPEAADAAIEAIFGGRADKVSDALSQLTLADEAFTDLEGRAADAATEIDNSLRGALDDFVLWIQSEISEFLNSSTIDIPGKVAELKERLQDALGALAEGESIGMALELAFDAPGLSDSIERLESAIGQFVIEFSLGVASILSAFGNTQGADQVRQFAQGLAAEQLEFDLSIADNGQELTQAVTDALRRGVDTQSIYESARDSIRDAMEAGNTEAAQEIASTFEVAFRDSPVANMFDGLSDSVDEQIADIQQAAELAAAAATRVPAELAYQSGSAGPSPTAPPPIGPDVVADMALVIQGTQDAQDAVIISAGAIGEAVQGADEVIHEAIIGGSIVPDLGLVGPAAQTSFARVGIAGAAMSLAMMANGAIVNMVSFQIVTAFRYIESGSTALLVAATRVNILEDAIIGLGNVMPTLDAVAQKLASISGLATHALGSIQAVASAGNNVTTNNTTNININQNNNVQNSAQAASVSQQTANSVRGF